MSTTTTVWTCNTGWSDEEQFRVEAIWSYSQNVANNTTTITLEKLRFMEVRQLCLAWCQVTFEGGWSGNTTTGSVKLSQTWGPPYYEEVTINKSKTFSNDSNGYAQGLNFQWRCYVNTSDYRAPKQTSLQTYSIASSTVPRLYLTSGLSFSASSVAMGSAVTCKLDVKSSSYTHKLYYKFGSLSGQTISSSVAAGTTSVSWTPPISLASQIPSAVSGSATVTLETYSGSTKIGTTSKTITLTVPSSVVPSVSVAVSDANGYASTYGAYVSGKSKLKVVSTASGSYSSTISKIAVTVQGSSYSGSSVTSNLLTGSGSGAWSVTVTDSRGRTASKSGSVTILAYSAPTAGLTCYRMDADGNVDDQGEYLRSDWSYNITSLNSKNGKTAKIQYQLNGTWTDIATVTDGYSKSGTLKETSHALDLSTTYNVRIAVSDNFTTTYRQIKVSTAFDLINLGAGGKSIAFGKRSANAGKLEVALESVFQKAVALEDALSASGSVVLSSILTVAGLITSKSNINLMNNAHINQYDTISYDGSTPSSNHYTTQVNTLDTSGRRSFFMEKCIDTSGTHNVYIFNRRYKSSSEYVDCHLDLYNYTDGTSALKFNGAQVVHGSNFRSVIPTATTSASGLISASDKAKVDKLDSYGAAAWTELKTAVGSDTKGTKNSFTLGTSIENYNEIMVMCVQNAAYTASTRRYFVLGSTVVPIAYVKASYVDYTDGTFGTVEANGYHAGVSFTSATTGYLYAYYSDARVILLAR